MVYIASIATDILRRVHVRMAGSPDASTRPDRGWKFEWNEAKRQKVIKQHGVDIVYASQMFEGSVLTRIDERKDYGEVRLISMGVVENECFVVVHTERGDTTRLITAWKGGRDEWTQYQAGFARRNQTDED